MNKLYVGILIAAAFLIGLLSFRSAKTPTLNGAPMQGTVYTTGSGFAESTTTINTTSTQVFASIGQLSYIEAPTAATITCSLDAQGTTAASSTVQANRGVIIPASTTGNPVPTVSFGQCIPGSPNCFPHRGAVNCLASSAVTVTKIVQ